MLRNEEGLQVFSLVFESLILVFTTFIVNFAKELSV